MLNYIIDFIKGLIAKEPARLVGYGSAIALTLALKGAEMAGVTLPPEVLTGAQAFGGFIVLELIRRLVFSPDRVEAEKEEAAAKAIAAEYGEPI
jgi:hypothetical protein